MAGACFFMEEKKLLWVVLLLSLFLLIVFGSVFYLYSPSRSQSSATFEDLAYMKEISERKQNSKIDPDMWSRQKDKIPEYKTEDEGNSIDKSITTVAGDNVEDEKTYIDISASDSNKNIVKEGKKLPKEVAKELKVGENSGGNAKKSKVESEQKKRDASSSAPSKRNIKNEKKSDGKTTPPLPKKDEPNIKEKRNIPVNIETVYWVQTASLTSRLNAERARNELVSRHMKVEIFTRDTAAGLTHRVRVGPFKNNTEAEYWLKNIKAIKGFEGSYISQEHIRV